MYRKWHDYYDPGVPTTIDYPLRPQREYFKDWVKKQPDKVYLIHGDREITYTEANSIACRLANRLLDLGYKKQDRIALMAPNIPEYVLAQQACFKLNAIMVPTNPAYTAKELTHQFKDSGTETVIVFSAAADKVIDIMHSGETNIKRVVVMNSPGQPFQYENEPNVFDFYSLVGSGVDLEPTIEVSSEDVCMLQYTGGTTGVSKGCVLTNANIEAMAWIDWHWFSTPLKPFNEQFRCLVAVPVYHIYGFNCNVNMNLIDGGTLILVDAPRT